MVVLGELVDNSDGLEHVWQDLRDFLRSSLFDSGTRLTQGVQKLEVVLSFLITSLDLLLEIQESWQVGT